VAGGAEQVLLQLDRALTDAGHRSVVIASSGSKIAGELVATPKPRGIVGESAKELSQRRHARAIGDVLSSHRIDVVHLHGCDFYSYLPAARVPVLATLHLPLEHYPPEALRPRRPDTWVHCVSAAQHETRPCGTHFLPPIENGVAAPPGVGSLKDSFALYLGRICPEKGLHLAIEASKRAACPLVIAGEVFPYETHLRYFHTQIEPNLTDDCRFVGNVGPARKHELLSKARCLVVPSTVEETSSLVAREALATGTPVIAFKRRALTDVIEDGRTGFTVNSMEEMAAGIVAAQRLDPEDCRRSADRFSLGRMIDEYFSVYRQLSRRRNRSASAGC
jgi:glycosyltransferase involved in cell wall biosynthesis